MSGESWEEDWAGQGCSDDDNGVGGTLNWDTSTDFYHDYEQVKLLGMGGNGEDHFCKDRNSGTLRAVKTMRVDDVPHEVMIMETLGKHQNIVGYDETYDYWQGDVLVGKIVLEYCALGNLKDYAESFTKGIPEIFLWGLLAQLSSAHDHLHKNGVVHADLKLENVLVTPSTHDYQWPTLKLADFGSSTRNAPRYPPLAHLQGTNGYNPPEADRMVGPEADVWNLGVIVHRLTLGQKPITDAGIEDIEEPITETWWQLSGKTIPEGTDKPQKYMKWMKWNAQHPIAPKRIDDPSNLHCYSKLLDYFMMRCLDMDWETRITASQLSAAMSKLEPSIYRT